MTRPQLLVLGMALAVTGILYSLPKVIVNDKEKGMQTAAQPAPAQAQHAQGVPKEQAALLESLRNQYRNASDTEKKIIFADSLADMYRSAMMFDSVVAYREFIAGQVPDERSRLAAADACYDAFFFVTDAEKAAAYGLKAQQHYQKVLSANPKRLDAKAKMAMTYANSATPMQAVMLLREVIAEDPRNEQALFNLGLLSIRSGQYDKAVERFETLLKQNPQYLQAKLYLGISHAELGNAVQARKLLEEAKAATQDVMIQNAADEYLNKLPAEARKP